jgi:hypothetical protein
MVLSVASENSVVGSFYVLTYGSFKHAVSNSDSMTSVNRMVSEY